MAFLRKIKSIVKPQIIPIKTLIVRMEIMVFTGTLEDSMIGSISSLVARYTDIKVPNVIMRVVYRLVARAEKPH